MELQKEDEGYYSISFPQADEKLIVRYLLGDMKEEERTRVEERFFEDDEFYAQMTALQEELIDDYVHGDLAARERDLFEKHFLSSPKRRERVEFAATLARALPEPQLEEKSLPFEEEQAAPVKESFWWQSALLFLRPQRHAFALAGSVAMLLFLSGVIWLAIENRRLGAQLERARNQQTELSKRSETKQTEFEQKEREREQEIANLRSQSDDLNKRLQEERGRVEELERQAASESRSSNSFVAFALLPGLRGSGNEPGDEPERLVIPPETSSVRLQLELHKEEDYRSYRAELRTAGGNQVWSQGLLEAARTGEAQVVLLTIPARALSLGEYEVTLAGVDGKGNREVVGYYYFIALKR
ncbi:MAG: hypothetical protein L0229_07675 [Blastocatellia bacterium]|nr:hypothetical protein [Blastocatellia bacterium]